MHDKATLMHPLSRARMLTLTGAGILGAVGPSTPPARAADPGARRFPFEYVFRQIRFAVTVDGRGPLTFALDSGAGSNVVFTGAAQRIGLTGGRGVKVTGISGDARGRFVHVDKLAAGPVVLENQNVLVVDLPGAEAIGLDGLIGYQLLRRFAVTVDFDARTITVWDGSPDNAHLGDAVPIVFRDGILRIGATVDGIDATFNLDTGDVGGIALFAPFVRAHGFLASAPPRFFLPTGSGNDVGGQDTTYGVARGKALRIGPLTLDAPLYRYTNATSGAFARTDLAGNLGIQVWQRFLLTFDYARNRVLLRPRTVAHEPFVFNRTGLIANPTAQGLIVIAVIPASPAATAGVAAGDRVLAVAGQSVDGHGLELVPAAFLQPAGTVLAVRLLRGNTPLDVTLTLADLI